MTVRVDLLPIDCADVEAQHRLHHIDLHA